MPHRPRLKRKYVCTNVVIDSVTLCQKKTSQGSIFFLKNGCLNAHSCYLLNYGLKSQMVWTTFEDNIYKNITLTSATFFR
jgi:hypothetical protein